MTSQGFRGFPVATIALYGPDDHRASKVAVGIIRSEDEGPDILRRWYSDADIRYDLAIQQEILEFIKENRAKSAVLADRIVGCPHEENVDYPSGRSCPRCPFWAGRDRWTGEMIH